MVVKKGGGALDGFDKTIPGDRDQKIFIVRHARPELPFEGKLYYGHTDYGLSVSGIECAEQLREDLRGIEFAKIYCSDLIRARHTAELIAPNQKEEIIITPALREIFLGEWEAKSFDEVRSAWNDLYEKRGASFDKVPPPGGESFCDLQKRAEPAFADILDKSPAGNILIVAHAAFIWAVMCSYFSFDLKDLFYYPLDFCGVHLLHNSRGHLRMMRYNWNPRLLECRFW